MCYSSGIVSRKGIGPMATEVRLLTADELFNLPDDDWCYELIEGVLHKMPPPGRRHGRVAARLIMSLGNYVEARSLGEVYTSETGFLLARNPDTVLAPDVAFVQREQLAGVDDVGYFPGAPDLVGEVV